MQAQSHSIQQSPVRRDTTARRATAKQRNKTSLSGQCQELYLTMGEAVECGLAPTFGARHQIKAEQLVAGWSGSAEQVAELKRLLIDLVGYSVEWEEQDRNRKTWCVAALLSQASLEKGDAGWVVEFSYSPNIKRKLFQPEIELAPTAPRFEQTGIRSIC